MSRALVNRCFGIAVSGHAQGADHERRLEQRVDQTRLANRREARRRQAGGHVAEDRQRERRRVEREGVGGDGGDEEVEGERSMLLRTADSGG